jgi:phage terminase large subunit-like protein
MVKHTIAVAARARGLTVPVVVIRATRGKRQRAEPIATLYESGEVLHEVELPQLEREWTRWVPGDAESPNRVDAAVWLMTRLMISGKREFKVR